jgi:Fungal specific transcription factor domain
MVFTSQAYLSLVSGRETSGVMQGHSQHLSKALRYLRERLLLGDQKPLSDETVMVVMALVIHAYMTGDHKSVRCHLNGLQRIVNLRGGLTSFRNNAKLLVQIMR